jgi:predicted RNase H-like nuclease
MHTTNPMKTKAKTADTIAVIVSVNALPSFLAAYLISGLSSDDVLDAAIFVITTTYAVRVAVKLQ